MKFVALVLAVILTLGFLATADESKPVTVTCGAVSGTQHLTAKGIDVAEKIGRTIDRLANGSTPESEVRAAVAGAQKILVQWITAFVFGARGKPLPPQLIRLQKERDADLAAAETACTPCPGAPGGAPGPPGGGPPVDSLVRAPAYESWTAEQMSIAATAVKVGQANNIPQRGWVINVASGLVESGLRNLDYGDRDSVGYQQQRTSSGWGTIAEIRDVSKAAAAFYGVADHTSNDGLVDIPNWQTRPMGEVAQAIQVSAHPGRYAARLDEAQAIVTQVIAADRAGEITAAALSESSPPVTPNPPVLDPADPQQTGCTGVQNGRGNGAVGDLSIATWNVLKSSTPASIRRGVGDLGKTTDIIGLQEVGDPADQAAARAALPGFTMTRFGNAVPILWRTDKYTMLAQEQTLAFGPGQKVEKVQGQAVVGPKWITTVQLTEKASGRTFAVSNTHLLMGAHRGTPKRMRLYERQARLFASKLQTANQSGFPALGLCDCNSGVTKTKAAAILEAVGATHNWATLGAQSTHGNTTIDYVWALGAIPTSQRVGKAGSSDHRPVIVDFAPADAVASPTTHQIVDADFSKLTNTRTVAQAVDFLEGYVTSGRPIRVNRCLHYMALAYGYPTTDAQTALAQWQTQKPQYKHADTTGIPPRGALVFWTSNNPAGHIAVSLGDGRVISTDAPVRGKMGIVTLATIDRWDSDKTTGRLGWTSPYFAGRTGVTA